MSTPVISSQAWQRRENYQSAVRNLHSGPKVSNDNPYSEAWFKTLKYAPVFPEQFGSLAEAKAFMDEFVSWYNCEHHHQGIGSHTPTDVHYGLAAVRANERADVFAAARAAHPELFSIDQILKVVDMPEAAWINKPNDDSDEDDQPVYEPGAQLPLVPFPLTSSA